MSAHVEFDFNDDGTITMTHRPEKGAPVCVFDYPKLADGQAALINALGADDSTITHQIIIGTKATIAVIRGPLVETKAERKTITVVSCWGIG